MYGTPTTRSLAGRFAVIETPMTLALGTIHPVMNAGMGHIAVPELAAAVSAAGGLGLLATSTLSPNEVRVSVQRIRGLTGAPFGANVTLGFPNGRQNAAVLVEERVPVLNLSLGIDAEVIDAVHAYGGKVVSTVTNRRHARSAAERGVDAVIVTGHEAAGHGSEVSSLVLIPLVRREVDIPLIAAGGFADGAGLAAALMLGADGVSMGTRFALTAESPVHERVVRLLLAASESETILTDRIDGLLSRLFAVGRALELASAGRSQPVSRELAGDTYTSVRCGDVTQGVVAIGQVVGAVRHLLTCREVVESTVANADQLLADAADRLPSRPRDAR
jgi:NAD(P)H-dependent flavin oxidoreductase YrpB (nitropropane dioxygenase family)